MFGVIPGLHSLDDSSNNQKCLWALPNVHWLARKEEGVKFASYPAPLLRTAVLQKSSSGQWTLLPFSLAALLLGLMLPSTEMPALSWRSTFVGFLKSLTKISLCPGVGSLILALFPILRPQPKPLASRGPSWEHWFDNLSPNHLPKQPLTPPEEQPQPPKEGVVGGQVNEASFQEKGSLLFKNLHSNVVKVNIWGICLRSTREFSALFVWLLRLKSFKICVCVYLYKYPLNEDLPRVMKMF